MKKHFILWADDDADDLMLMREILKDTTHDFEIIEVENGRKALDFLKKAKQNNNLPCLIILDMNMPVLNGRETLSIIKNGTDFKHIPVVMFTTSNSELDRMFCRRYNVEMVTKPPEYASLINAVQKLLKLCVPSEKKYQ